MKQLSLAALATIICAVMLHGDAEDTPSQLVVDTLYGDVPFVRFEPPEEHAIPPEYNHDIPQPQSIGVARSVRVPDQLRPPQQLPAPPAHRPQNSPTFHAWEIPGVRGAYFGISIVPAQSPRPEKILDVRSFAFQKFKKKDSDPLHGYSPQQFLNKLVHQWNSYGCLTGKPSFEHYAFTHFNYYQFGGFRELLPHLNGYRSFLEEVVTETDKNKKMRKKLDNITGMKKKLVHHFRDELKRVNREYHERRRYEEEQRKRQEQYEREVAEYKQQCQEVQREKERIQQQYLQRHHEWSENYEARQKQEQYEREQRTGVLEADYAAEQEHAPRHLPGKLKNSWLDKKLFSVTPTREILEGLEHAFSTAENDSNNHDLVELGRHFLREATEAFEHNCAEECITALDRTRAVLQTIEDGQAVHTQTYKLSDHAKQYGTEFDMDPAALEQFSGNHLQQFINNDLVRIVNDAADIRFAHENNFHINNLSRMIFHCCDISLAHNIEAEYQTAFDFLDLSQAFCTMTQKLAYAFGKGVVTGAVSGVKDLATFACSLVVNPPDTIIDFMKSTWQVVTVLSKVVHRGVTDPAESSRRAYDLSAKLAAHVYEHPEESVEQTTSFITNFLMQGYLCAKAVPRIKKLAMHLSKVMQDETALLKGAKIVQPEAQKLIAPVSYLARETVDAVHTPLYTRTTVLEAIEEMPTIMLDKHVEKWAISNLDVINEYRIVYPLKGMVHTYWGEYRFPHQITKATQMSTPGLLKGMHTYEGLEYFKRHFEAKISELSEIRSLPLEHEATLIVLPRSAFASGGTIPRTTIAGQKIKGYKTLWPQESTFESIVRDAKNVKIPKNKMNVRDYQGLTQDGLQIQVWLDAEEKFITNTYPNNINSIKQP